MTKKDALELAMIIKYLKESRLGLQNDYEAGYIEALMDFRTLIKKMIEKNTDSDLAKEFFVATLSEV